MAGRSAVPSRLIVLGVIGIAFVLIAGCSRGPTPPEPTEALRPTTVGVISNSTGEPPFVFTNGERFDVPAGAPIRRLTNWPNKPGDDFDQVGPGMLVLGGQAADRSWWYETISFGPQVDGCWLLRGGSFDRGDTIQFSSGLEIPKSPTFEIRSHGQPPAGAFPGHQDDGICIDARGHAAYFDLFVGQ